MNSLEGVFMEGRASRGSFHQARTSKSGSRAMARVFKQWIPSAAEIELLHECWLARLPPAVIAARLGISEPKLTRFTRRVRVYADGQFAAAIGKLVSARSSGAILKGLNIKPWSLNI